MVAPDIEVTAELARRLLRAQHPDLAGLRLELVANGWDNAMLRLGPDLAVRLPRRAAAAELVRHEQRWLPELAPRLPVPVPVPVRVGMPQKEYPWHWSIVPWRKGERLASRPLPDRRELAGSLAAFHRALHVPAPPDAPVNPVRGVPLATRLEAVRRRVDAGIAPPDAAAAVKRLARAPGWTGPAVWLHGDPHPGNLLVLDGGGLAVIDFGDLTSGDPATDLASAWLVFDAAGRAAYRRALRDVHPPDDPVWLRARGWAITMATGLLESTAADAWLLELGHQALAEALGED